MANFCLPKPIADALRKNLKGELSPEKLAEMTSGERRALFSNYLGEEFATKVNAEFEGKLLLKNQQQGMINWIKGLTGMKADVKRDMLSKVERLKDVLNPAEEKAFLQDLANQRLGIGVTAEEAKNLSELSDVVETKKAQVPTDSPKRSQERLEYGLALQNFKEYVGDLTIESEKKGVDYYKANPLRLAPDALYKLGGLTKSILSSLDNSFFGRQGIKALFTNPDIWAKNFAKSWGDIGKELVGKDAMTAIKADVFSRPRAMNGDYARMKLAVGVDTEEAFPTALPAKIPVLGRLFKASESAFNGAALRMRADLADRLLDIAEKQGVSIKDKEQALAIGSLVNSMTGRGGLGIAEPIAKGFNATMFSVRFLKSNFDTLTAHQFSKTATPFMRKQAAKNLLKIVGSVAGILGIAKALNPDSVVLDSRSSRFGKIRLNGVDHDITGGMAGLLTLASRLVPTEHKGKWGFWTINSKGQYVELGSGKFGAQTPLDVLQGFAEGKVSPLLGVVRDYYKGQDYDDNKINFKQGNAGKSAAIEGAGLVTPIPVSTFQQLKKADSDGYLANLLLDALGAGASVPYSATKK